MLKEELVYKYSERIFAGSVWFVCKIYRQHYPLKGIIHVQLYDKYFKIDPNTKAVYKRGFMLFGILTDFRGGWFNWGALTPDRSKPSSNLFTSK